MRQEAVATLHDEDRIRREHETPRHGMPDDDGGQRETEDGPRSSRVALEGTQQEQHRNQTQGDEHRIRTRLLRPLDEERTRGEQQTADQGDSSIEELVGKHHEETDGHRRTDHGGESQRPLRRSRESRPGLDEHEVEEVELHVELLGERVLHLGPVKASSSQNDGAPSRINPRTRETADASTTSRARALVRRRTRTPRLDPAWTPSVEAPTTARDAARRRAPPQDAWSGQRMSMPIVPFDLDDRLDANGKTAPAWAAC